MYKSISVYSGRRGYATTTMVYIELIINAKMMQSIGHLLQKLQEKRFTIWNKVNLFAVFKFLKVKKLLYTGYLNKHWKI